MKRSAFSLAAAALAVALLSAPAPAQAYETNGKFGLGYDADLNGVTFRYFIGQLGLDFTFGFAMQTARADGEEVDFDLIFAPRLVYAMRLHEKINLNVGGGMFIQVLGTNAPDTTDMNLGFFGGFSPEVILWDHLSVEVFFGMALSMNNLLEEQAEKINISFGTLGNQLSVVSGAVFRYYF
jgi:opacity protein-like surface antigen